MNLRRITRITPAAALAASMLLAAPFAGGCQTAADRTEIVNAAGGTLDSASVGPFMQARLQELQQRLASAISSGLVSVTYVDPHSIQVTTTGNLIFLPDVANIQPEYFPVIQAIADMVQRNGKLGVKAIGYPDTPTVNLGEHNLAYFRAVGLQQQLIADGVPKILASPVPSNGNPMLEGQAQFLIEPVMAN